MNRFLSSVWAHLGTLLMGVLAVLCDVGVITPHASVTIALDAVAGLLIALHAGGLTAIEKAMTAAEGQVRSAKATTAASAPHAAAAPDPAAVAQAVASVLGGAAPPHP